MIPFGSQRASGQDLATHLLNAHDNEQVEIASVRGAIARDLHGAFEEWESSAHAFTRCRKYLYSLSINPDPAQDRLTRAQYEDYITRVEDRLGLTGQPRAIVFHVKNGRQHCHVIWSRIDLRQRKAIPISFDREKLMAVTREFADHYSLPLPAGYHRPKGEPPRQPQITLYENVQEARTGISREQRISDVTAAWQHSDNARSFVHALEELGYVLAQGKRPYVLVDIYGEVNALPKLVTAGRDGLPVRTKDVRALLEKDFPPEALPSVEEARQFAVQRRKAREDRAKDRIKKEQKPQRKAMQRQRREALCEVRLALTRRHVTEDWDLASRHQQQIFALGRTFREDNERIRQERIAARPRGLAGFLGRITGMVYLIGRIHRRQDRRREARHLAKEAALQRGHEEQRAALTARHQAEYALLRRHFRALAQIEQRELRSLDTQALRAMRIDERERWERAAARYDILNSIPKGAICWEPAHQPAHGRGGAYGVDGFPDLHRAFMRAAEDDDDGDADDGSGRSGRLQPWIPGFWYDGDDRHHKPGHGFNPFYDFATACTAACDPWPNLHEDFQRAAGGETDGKGKSGGSGARKPGAEASEDDVHSDETDGRSSADDFAIEDVIPPPRPRPPRPKPGRPGKR